MKSAGTRLSPPSWTSIVWVAVLAGAVSCGLLEQQPSSGALDARAAPDQRSSVFTPANSSLREAVNDFFWVKARPEQPTEFSHQVHVENKIGCAEYCHESATKGPIAGLPSVNTCMICHMVIATDRPLVQQIAALQEKGLDLEWQRVYRYANEAHVWFDHAPHVRAKVECSTCHGNVARQTVAERNVDVNMGFCVNCHLDKNAPNECITCHF